MVNIQEKLDSILMAVEKPARYQGNEWNSHKKDLTGAHLIVALAFPDVYEVGMSHLGLRILYGLLNQQEGVAAERVYAPWPDMEDKMRQEGLPLFTLESLLPLGQVDILGFTLQYQLSYTNILNMLDLGNVPLQSADRNREDPLVIAGGPDVFNPEPLSPFIDLFVLGEGEEVILEIVQAYRLWKGQEGCSRKDLLRRAAGIPGVYVPSLYQDYYDNQGNFLETIPLEKDVPPVVEKRVVANLEEAFFPVEWIVPYLAIIHDRIVLEIFRGCTQGCRFCQAGMQGRPVRERSPEKIRELACQSIDLTGYEEISLASLSSSDYSSIEFLLESIQEILEQKGVRVTLPSLRLDSFSVQLARGIQKKKKSSLTFAPEAGSQRLRDVINKKVREEDLQETLKEAFREGWNQVKLYFIIGLPTEEWEDMEAIVSLARRVEVLFKRVVPDKKRWDRFKVTVSTSTFVPKAHTPFQWEPQVPLEEILQKQKFLKEKIRGRHLVYNWHQPGSSLLEAALSRGDRRTAWAVYQAWKLGCRFDGWSDHFDLSRWREAFQEAGLSLEYYANRELSPGENLPWGHLSCGVTPGFLKEQRELSREGAITPDCREGPCARCGACRKGV